MRLMQPEAWFAFRAASINATAEGSVSEGNDLCRDEAGGSTIPAGFADPVACIDRSAG